MRTDSKPGSQTPLSPEFVDHLLQCDVSFLWPEFFLGTSLFVELIDLGRPRSGQVWLMPNRWVILDDVLQANAGGKVCFT